MNERAVRHIVHTSGCIDTSNPKFAEIAFFGFTSDVSVVLRFHNSLASYAVKFGLAAPVAFGLFQDFSAFFNGVDGLETTAYVREL